ncbi:MAG TPA: NAD(+)/NADH kinase, partial [Bacillota bacterium]
TSAAWKPRKIHLFAPDRDRAKRIGDRLERMLQTAGLPLTAQPESADDLVISIGGDGTFLSALRRYRALNPVFCGVNAGHLGFLHEIDEDNLIPAVDRILKGQYFLEEHGLLAVQVLAAEGRAVRNHRAFNDVVVERRDTRTLRLLARVDGTELGPLIGDGVLVTSAGGSTAYALAAGGAIVHPACPVLQLIPLHAHRSRIAASLYAPLIVPLDAVIELEPLWSQNRMPRLVIDGEEVALEEGERVRIERAPEGVRILRLGIASFWDRLREKLL